MLNYSFRYQLHNIKSPHNKSANFKVSVKQQLFHRKKGKHIKKCMFLQY